jgi:hypothetical protein
MFSCAHALAAAGAWPTAAAGQVACDELREPGIPRVVISSVEESPRDVARGWPARCTVSGAIDGRIRFALHLLAAPRTQGRISRHPVITYCSAARVWRRMCRLPAGSTRRPSPGC